MFTIIIDNYYHYIDNEAYIRFWCPHDVNRKNVIYFSITILKTILESEHTPTFAEVPELISMNKSI